MLYVFAVAMQPERYDTCTTLDEVELFIEPICTPEIFYMQPSETRPLDAHTSHLFSSSSIWSSASLNRSSLARSSSLSLSTSSRSSSMDSFVSSSVLVLLLSSWWELCVACPEGGGERVNMPETWSQHSHEFWRIGKIRAYI
jgi:hypothetical protein